MEKRGECPFHRNIDCESFRCEDEHMRCGECEKKRCRCRSCGWRPAVETKRITQAHKRLNEQCYDEDGRCPGECGNSLLFGKTYLCNACLMLCSKVPGCPADRMRKEKRDEDRNPED